MGGLLLGGNDSSLKIRGFGAVELKKQPPHQA